MNDDVGEEHSQHAHVLEPVLHQELQVQFLQYKNPLILQEFRGDQKTVNYGEEIGADYDDEEQVRISQLVFQPLRGSLIEALRWLRVDVPRKVVAVEGEDVQGVKQHSFFECELVGLIQLPQVLLVHCSRKEEQKTI